MGNLESNRGALQSKKLKRIKKIAKVPIPGLLEVPVSPLVEVSWLAGPAALTAARSGH